MLLLLFLDFGLDIRQGGFDMMHEDLWQDSVSASKARLSQYSDSRGSGVSQGMVFRSKPLYWSKLRESQRTASPTPALPKWPCFARCPSGHGSLPERSRAGGEFWPYRDQLMREEDDAIVGFFAHTLPARMSMTFWPRSMMSTLVRTPMVRTPSGSTSRAILRPSLRCG